MSALDLLLFDLDGTLSDPLLGIGRSINHALTHFGHTPLELADAAVYIGAPIDQAFRAITGVQSTASLADLVAKYRERYSDIGYAENVVYEGVPEVLGRLSDAGMPLAVCTSKRQDIAEQILERFSLRRHFRFVNGGDVGIQKWQQIESLKAAGLVSAASIMIGDRALDLLAAHRNAIAAAGVLWGHGSAEELKRENPQFLFSAPSELFTLATL